MTPAPAEGRLRILALELVVFCCGEVLPEPQVWVLAEDRTGKHLSCRISAARAAGAVRGRTRSRERKRERKADFFIGNSHQVCYNVSVSGVRSGLLAHIIADPGPGRNGRGGYKK